MTPIKYEIPSRFIISGCSITASSSSIVELKKQIYKWPDPLVVKYNIEVFCNLAIPGAGNNAICQNISYVLNTQQTTFSPEKTLILFNLADLDRIDLIAPSNHPDINTGGSWHNVFPFSWVTSGGWLGQASGSSRQIINSLQKVHHWDQAILANCLATMNFLKRLDADNYRYYFMFNADHALTDAPLFFQDFIRTKDKNWIRFGEFLSIRSFGKSIGELESDNAHLTLPGYQEVAKIVDFHIKQHFGQVD